MFVLYECLAMSACLRNGDPLGRLRNNESALPTVIEFAHDVTTLILQANEMALITY